MEKRTIGQFLSTLRRANGYTQQEVADKLGVSNKTLSSWETDKTAPDIILIPALADLYGVTCDEILRGCRENPESRSFEEKNETSAELLKPVFKRAFQDCKAKINTLTCVAFGCLALILLFFFIMTEAHFVVGLVFFILSLCGLITCFILIKHFYDTALISVDPETTDDTSVKYRSDIYFLTQTSFKRLTVLTLCLFPSFIILLALTTVYNGVAVPVYVFVAIGTLLTVAIYYIYDYCVFKNLKKMQREENSAVYERKKSKVAKHVKTQSIALACAAALLLITALLPPINVKNGTIITDESLASIKKNCERVILDTREYYFDFELSFTDEQYEEFLTEGGLEITHETKDEVFRIELQPIEYYSNGIGVSVNLGFGEWVEKDDLGRTVYEFTLPSRMFEYEGERILVTNDYFSILTYQNVEFTGDKENVTVYSFTEINDDLIYTVYLLLMASQITLTVVYLIKKRSF